MKRLLKKMKKNIYYILPLTLCAIFFIILLVWGLIVYCHDDNADKLEFIGSLIGFAGIIMTIFCTTHLTKSQLRQERQNNFDSAIGIENYKQYMDLAEKCCGFADELIQLEQGYSNGNLNADDYQAWDKDLDKFLLHLDTKFHTLDELYKLKMDETDSNHLLEGMSNDFNNLLKEISSDRTLVNNVFSQDVKNNEANYHQTLQQVESHLYKMQDFLIRTATRLVQ